MEPSNDLCKICSKKVHKLDNAIVCDICNTWVHTRCNKLDKKDYKTFKDDEDKSFYCLHCMKDTIPFTNLTDTEFYRISGDGDNFNFTASPNVPLSPIKHLMFDRINNWVNELNSTNLEDNNIEANEMNCNYFTIDEFNGIKNNSNESFSILHLNIHSIQLHIDEFRIFLNTLNHKFDIIALSETKLQNEPAVNINLTGFHNPIHTFTEATKGGVCIYISVDMDFKPRNDLKIYESKMIESLFIEIINKNEANKIVGVLYRHPSMDMDVFNENKLELLLNKLNREKNKKVYLAGDFNFDLLKVNRHDETSVFFNKMMSNFLLPVISIPTKINTVNDTLIDNIFTNEFNPDLISGNFTEDISDHLPSFLIIPKSNMNKLPKEHNIFTRDLNKVNYENFFLDLLAINMDEISSNPDANTAFINLYESTHKVIDEHMPLRKITNKEFKRRFKPWISNGILNSINRKNKLYKKYIKCNNEVTKPLLYNEYKSLKNHITELIRISKKSHYANYFIENNNNLRKIWDGIKELVNIKPKNSESINCILYEGKNLTDPKKIANSFNTYFSTIADDLLSKKKYNGNKTYAEYLKRPLSNSFVFRPCDKIEIELLISEININKSTGPNGIPTKILHLISQ